MKYRQLVIAFLMLLTTSGINGSIVGNLNDKGLDLYNISDKLASLTGENFNANVYNRPFAWLIEFYNSWCGFCKQFAPIWKEFAINVNDWQDIVMIGAINCALDKNTAICRDFDIMGYPTIKYFHEEYQELPSNLGEIVKGANSAELTKVLVKQLQRDQSEGLGKTWPSLLTQNFTQLNEIKPQDESEILFLIFEEPDSTIGSEVILDLHRYKRVKIWKISSQNELTAALAVKNFPALYVIDTNLNNADLLSIESTRAEIKGDIIKYIKSKNIGISENNLKPPITPIKEAEKNDRSLLANKQVGNTVFQTDLEAALRYTVKHEITALKTISGESLAALQNYLQVLIKYFPFQGNTLQFVTKLSEKISEKSTAWSGKELSILIEELEKEYEPVYSTSLEWVGCKGSTPQFRGFTCALWTLFHTLAVREYIQPSFETPKVLEAMHGFVKHFFGCSDCSQHFQEMAIKKKMDSVSDSKGAMLWLWDAHNTVNQRLAGDPTEDPVYPKRQFPVDADCPRCRYSNGSWNTDEVHSFLINMYGGDRINFMGSFKTSSSSKISNIDKVLMALLYIYCIGSLVFILHLIVSKRRYRKKAYNYDLLGKV